MYDIINYIVIISHEPIYFLFAYEYLIFTHKL